MTPREKKKKKTLACHGKLNSVIAGLATMKNANFFFFFSFKRKKEIPPSLKKPISEQSLGLDLSED